MNWSFALINGKLAEVFFERKGKEIHFLGHCLVKASEYKTVHEKSMIKKDTASNRLRYTKGNYVRV